MKPVQPQSDTYKLHRQVEGMVRRSIEEGQLRPGDQLPTEAELCRQFGVSRSTVHMALNRLKKEGLILRTPGKGTFVSSNDVPHPPTQPAPSKGARLIHTASRNSIGVVMSFAGHDATQHVMQINILLGIEHAIKSRGYNMLFVRTDEYDETGEQKAIRELQSTGMAGLIVMPIASHTETAGVKELLEQRVPIVLVDRYLSALDTSYVVSDNYRGAYLITEHLIGLGYEHFKFVLPLLQTAPTQLSTTSIGDRYRGYCQALQDYELGDQVQPADVLDMYNATAVRDLLLTERPKDELPLAIFALHDLIAIPLMNTAAKMGLVPPKDFAIVGFDDLPFCENLQVPLTSVAQPRYEIGFRAGHMLADRIEGNPIRNDKLSLMTAPVIRESCGAHTLVHQRVMRLHA
jgi:DNA-binding LacI/PurR family transcriptional regulator